MQDKARQSRIYRLLSSSYYSYYRDTPLEVACNETTKGAGRFRYALRGFHFYCALTL